MNIRRRLIGVDAAFFKSTLAANKRLAVYEITDRLNLFTLLMMPKPVPNLVLPKPALLRDWMTQFGVPAVGIGLIGDGEVIAANVYGELSNGVKAPPGAVWGSKALADALCVVNIEDEEAGKSKLPIQLFADLGMADTFFGDPIHALDHLARPHNKRKGIYVFKPYDTKAHLYTTINDICELLRYMLRQPNAADTLVNAGWQTTDNLPGALMHRAMGNGASHTILLLPQNKQAIAVLTNSDNGDRVEDCILKSMGVDITAAFAKV